ncbi:MAG: peptide transporter [Lentisphaeria bacterium]|nr:OPT/YSL family transporter [Lentisphaeria bacterium]NQZ70589.1 peptide transporter [Lentisphaeria bacterium]
MAFDDDKELNEYRDIMKIPEVENFQDGFNWKTVAGALFLGLMVNPATDYMTLFIGGDPAIAGAMKWVLIIFFAEIAKRSFSELTTQELYTLHFMAGAAMADPFSGFLFKQFVAQSEYVQGIGLAAELPSWAFPNKEAIAVAGKTFFAKCWIPIIGLTMFHMVVNRIDNYGLGYVLFRLVSDVERLPFPFAPVSAAGIVALSTDRGNEEPWRWRCFSIGGAMGMAWGLLYVVVPVVTEAFLAKRVEIIPLIFLDFTPQVGKFLPAFPVNIVFDFSAFLSGMIVPFWSIIGGFIGVCMTAVANPILQANGYLPSWKPEDSFIDVTYSNTIDFYMSFGIGLTFAVTFSQLALLLSSLIKNIRKPKGKVIQHEKSFAQRWREGWQILKKGSEARGDFSIHAAVGIYVVSVLTWVGLGMYLVAGAYPWMMMLAYALIVNPLISYATAKLEGICGQAVNLPYVNEIIILLSGYKGADIWFAPKPTANVGPETVGFKVLELTGTKISSQIKTLALSLPIVIVASLLTSEMLWRMADVPSSAYPYTEKMWDLQLKQWCLVKTSTLEGGSQFLEAWHWEYAGAGLGIGLALFTILNSLGLPIMLVFGAVWGLAQGSPGSIFLQMAGGFVGRFWFKRKFKDMWLRYMTVILAGFGCGMGLTSMIGMSLAVMKKMLQTTPW